MKIKKIFAYEILDSAGNPTVEAKVILEDGSIGLAGAPSGASTGTREAVELRDKDLRRYNGRGVLKAVENINKKISPLLINKDAKEQRKIDERIIELDGTENKSNLGANAIIAVSLAVTCAQAKTEKLPLYKYLAKTFGIKDSNLRLPKPMVVMIEGGKHADKSTDLQEYIVSALHDDWLATENIRMIIEIYNQVRKLLKANGFSTNVGNEGAFVPEGITSNEKPLEILLQSIKAAGYQPGLDAAISLDSAASELYKDDRYILRIENKKLTSQEMIAYYLKLFKKYPIVTAEDLLSESDWQNWPKLLEKAGKVKIVADDLTVTNPKLWRKAIEMKAANAILIKPNQAGTLSETIDCCLLARKHNLITIPSQRGGGETNDTFLVDLAVAVGSEWIKVGPTRGERVCKYNRLMEIERELLGK